MQLKEQLIGFPSPSNKKPKIFCGQIYKMPNQEKEHTMDIALDMEEEASLEEWDVPFSTQYTFDSFMTGVPKYLRTLNMKAEKMIKAFAPDP